MHGSDILLFCCGSDQLIEPRLLLQVEINRQNLRLIAVLIKRLEQSGFRNLDGSIIELGDPETDPKGTIVIGD